VEKKKKQGMVGNRMIGKGAIGPEGIAEALECTVPQELG
jgi:hypothetical protein